MFTAQLTVLPKLWLSLPKTGYFQPKSAPKAVVLVPKISFPAWESLADWWSWLADDGVSDARRTSVLGSEWVSVPSALFIMSSRTGICECLLSFVPVGGSGCCVTVSGS